MRESQRARESPSVVEKAKRGSDAVGKKKEEGDAVGKTERAASGGPRACSRASYTSSSVSIIPCRFEGE
eukprot:4747076-Pleurochrysis_carterae.AAC.1